MSEYEDLGEYNGDPVHDMWVDYTYHEYTGELSDEFDDDPEYDYDYDDDSNDDYDDDSDYIDDDAPYYRDPYTPVYPTYTPTQTASNKTLCSTFYPPRKAKLTLAEQIAECRSTIANYELKLSEVEKTISELAAILDDPQATRREKLIARRKLEDNYNHVPGIYIGKIESEQKRLNELIILEEKDLNYFTVFACVAAVIFSLIIFWIIY